MYSKNNRNFDGLLNAPQNQGGVIFMPKSQNPFNPRRRLSFEERVIIEDRLTHGKSLTDISFELERPVSTIGREVKNHAGVSKNLRNDCAFKSGCKHKGICGDATCRYICAHCPKKFPCKKKCPDYKPTACPKLSKPPYVCNGCPQKPYCVSEQRLYSAKKANDEAMAARHESNAGFDLTGEQFQAIDEMVSPMLRNGCSVYHVAKTLGNSLFVSEATLYRLIDKGELTARNIDLRRKVKLHPRKRRLMKNEQGITIRKVGHLWKDYLAYVAEHDDICVVQMDCVEGTKTSQKALLTLHWEEIGFQIARLMDAQTTENVVKTLDGIESVLGTEAFIQLFPVILTDNGAEFADIEGMERSWFDSSTKRTKVFFCEPNRSDEKGECENNHKYIRYIIPKGTDLDQFWQEDIDLCMSHVNSLRRKKVLGCSPIAIAKTVFPERFFNALSMVEIPSEKVVLRPELLHLVKDETSKYVKRF